MRAERQFLRARRLVSAGGCLVKDKLESLGVGGKAEGIGKVGDTSLEGL